MQYPAQVARVNLSWVGTQPMYEVAESKPGEGAINKDYPTYGLIRPAARSLEQDVVLLKNKLGSFVLCKPPQGDVAEIKMPVIRKVRGPQNLELEFARIITPVTGRRL
jgi:hypothetical protein